MKYGRVVDNVIVEIVEPINGFTIYESFHPLIVETLVPLPDLAEIGWVKQDDLTYVSPTQVTVEPIVEPVVETPVAPVTTGE